MKLDSDLRVTSTTHLWQIILKEFPFTNNAEDDKKGYAIQQSVWSRFAYNRRITSNLTATIHKTTHQLAGIFYESIVSDI